MADNFELLAILGTGTFGDAWVARSKKHDKKCVVKVINILRLSERELDQALTEVSVLGRMNHVNIVQYLDAYVHNGTLNIAMEYADGGDLHKKICDQKGVFFTKEVVMGWFVQICKALQYIHRQNILHRDLKSQNIFLTSKSIIKVGDFGIARILKDGSDLAVTTIGTPFYLSPEICQKRPYNHKSDMWALGCVLYEMCCLCVPFDGDSLQELILKILHEQYKAIPRFFGSTVSLLVKKLLDKTPEERPSADSILSMTSIQPYTPRGDSKILLKERRYSLPNITPRLQRDGKERKKSLVPSDKENVTPRLQRDGKERKKSLVPSDKENVTPSLQRDEKERKKSLVPSDKENIDPSFAGKTYLVRNPKFKQLCSTPNVSLIVAKQRKEDPTKLRTESKNEIEENPRSRLFSGVQNKPLALNNASNMPTTQRGNEIYRDSNDKNPCDTGITKKECLGQKGQKQEPRRKRNSLQSVSKPPSGRRSSLDPKPPSSSKEDGMKRINHSPNQGLKKMNGIRKSTQEKDGNGDLLSYAPKKSRLRSIEQETLGSRPAPIGTDFLTDSKVLPSRSHVLSSPGCDDDVFLDQNVKNACDRQSVDNAAPVEHTSYDRIMRRSSSYDCVFVNKPEIQSNENINRAKSAGSIGTKRFSKEGHGYRIVSSKLPAGQLKSETYAVQEDLQLNVDPLNTVYNCLCHCIQDKSQGQGLLYTSIVKSLGQGEANRCIDKMSQCILERAHYQDMRLIIPPQKHCLLPVMLIYILLIKCCK